MLDISPGTPRFAVLPPGDTIQSLPSLDYEAMLTQANGALTDVVQLTHDLQARSPVALRTATARWGS